MIFLFFIFFRRIVHGNTSEAFFTEKMPFLTSAACGLDGILTFNLFHRVITAKFQDTHRLFISEDSTVHYLAILNPQNPDMFVLLYVDENNESAVSI